MIGGIYKRTEKKIDTQTNEIYIKKKRMQELQNLVINKKMGLKKKPTV